MAKSNPKKREAKQNFCGWVQDGPGETCNYFDLFIVCLWGGLMEIVEVEFGLIEIVEVEIPERFFLTYFFFER